MLLDTDSRSFVRRYFSYFMIVVVYLVLTYCMHKRYINRYWNQVILLAMVNGIAAMSLNLVNGITGQFSLGHAGFMSVGAYGSAIITTKLVGGLKPGTAEGISVFAGSLLVGGLIAAFVGLLIGIPSLRLKGDYLAIITLGFSEIIRTLWRVIPVSGGAKGLSGIPKMADFTTLFIAVVVVMFLLRNYTASNYGRSSMAIRENELAAETMGVNTTIFKIKSFVFSAFIAGVAGGLYAHLIVFIQPNMFSQVKSTDMLLYLYAGGVGSYTSSLLGAFVFTALPEFLRSTTNIANWLEPWLPGAVMPSLLAVTGFISNWRLVVYALVMIVIMITRPKGIFGRYEFGFMRFGRPYVKVDDDGTMGIIERVGVSVRRSVRRLSGRKKGGN